MPEQKNQHYVPVLILKNFSKDSKNTNLFVIKTSKYANNIPIKDQSSEDYFYGKDKVVEKSLAELEKIFGLLLKEITEKNYFPSHGSFEHFLLNLFIVSTSARTLYSGEATNEQIDKMYSIVFSHHEKFDDFAKNYKVGIEAPSAFSLGIAVTCVKYIADLEYKILDNKTKSEFIISDNPVVKYNKFLLKKNWHDSHVGYGTLGIQFYCPLSPTKCLVLYDKNCYKFGNRKDRFIKVNLESDVQTINELQYINANEVVYFRTQNQANQISQIHEKLNRYKRKEKVKVTEYIQQGSTKEKGSSLIMSSATNIEIDLNLSFLKFTKKSNQIKLSNRAVQFRSDKILQMMKEDREKDNN